MTIHALRLFVGTFVSSSDRQRVANFQRNNQRLQESFNLRWVKPTKLHLTWNFLGETNEDRLPGIKAAVTDALQCFAQEQTDSAPLPAVSFVHAVFWPDSKHPKLLVVLPEQTSAQFNRLGELLREYTLKESLKNDPTPQSSFQSTSQTSERFNTFKPHVTIARMPKPGSGLHLKIEDFVGLESLTPLQLAVEQIELICSQTGRDAHEYISLANFSVNKLDKP